MDKKKDIAEITKENIFTMDKTDHNTNLVLIKMLELMQEVYALRTTVYLMAAAIRAMYVCGFRAEGLTRDEYGRFDLAELPEEEAIVVNNIKEIFEACARHKVHVSEAFDPAKPSSVSTSMLRQAFAFSDLLDENFIEGYFDSCDVIKEARPYSELVPEGFLEE